MQKNNITITIGNQKGGVSKTTTCCMLGYTLSDMGYKVLIVDLDPQANATNLLWLTSGGERDIENTLMAGITRGNIRNIKFNVKENLDMLPSHVDLEVFPEWIFENYRKQEDRDLLLSKLLEPLKSEYDFILIDTPPMELQFTKNAVCSSDYVLIVLQTQERSLKGAEHYIEKIAKLKDTYNLEVDIIGLVRVLMKNNGAIDSYISNKAIENFGEFVFDTIIPHMERLKRYDVIGINDEDMHDKRVLEKYNSLSKELILKINNDKIV